MTSQNAPLIEHGHRVIAGERMPINGRDEQVKLCKRSVHVRPDTENVNG
jgi:hypothetical protein